MSFSRKTVLLMLAGALISSQGFAEDEQNAAMANAEREVGETVVYGSRDVDLAFADPRYVEFWREQLQDQVAVMRLEEETEWRSVLTYTLNDNPNIVLGFDPKFDLERRWYLDITDETGETIKTATLVRAGFNWPY